MMIHNDVSSNQIQHHCTSFSAKKQGDGTEEYDDLATTMGLRPPVRLWGSCNENPAKRLHVFQLIFSVSGQPEVVASSAHSSDSLHNFDRPRRIHRDRFRTRVTAYHQRPCKITWHSCNVVDRNTARKTSNGQQPTP
jgi:hypothetical protein